MPEAPVSPSFLRVSRGLEPADLLLTGGRVVNVFTGRVEPGTVAIHGGRIAGIGDYTLGRQRVDVRGAYLASGFIDAHMHVESTMLLPGEFVRLASPHGTTGVVLDPHEIANVLGVAGIRYIMDECRGLPLNAMFALSSCVPSSHLETAGARLDAADLAPLFADERVVGLAEVMNAPGLIDGDADLLKKIALGLQRGVVDGHAPGLSGKDLQAYVSTGISSDHECSTAAEAMEKLGLGLHIHIREGSAARNLKALLPCVNAGNKHQFSFCTDDRHPVDLSEEGHIDHVVRQAVELGLDPVTAIAMASLHTARHYRRWDLGALAPGFQADVIVFDDLRDIRPVEVYFGGMLVSRRGEFVGVLPARAKPPACPIRLPGSLSAESFAVPVRKANALVRVIGMDPHQLVTEALALAPKVSENGVVADPTHDIAKLVVIERHRATGNVGIGFVKGFRLLEGALASTVGHDSHNLIVVGMNDGDMHAAARCLEEAGGGQCVVNRGKVLALLPLPIAGLMSDQPASTVIAQQRALLGAARSICSLEADPFMPLSFLSLPVIPHLKLTDLGLVDVDRFEVVPLEM